MSEYTVVLTTVPGVADEATLDKLLPYLEQGLTSAPVLGPVLALDAATGALTLTCQAEAGMGDAVWAIQLARQALADARSAAGVPGPWQIQQATTYPYTE